MFEEEETLPVPRRSLKGGLAIWLRFATHHEELSASYVHFICYFAAIRNQQKKQSIYFTGWEIVRNPSTSSFN